MQKRHLFTTVVTARSMARQSATSATTVIVRSGRQVARHALDVALVVAQQRHVGALA